MTGEIAIRNKIYGETSFYILSHQDEDVMDEVVKNTFLTSNPSFILRGWVDYDDEEHYLADMKLVNQL